MNPIRRIVDQLDVTPNPEKAMIPLSIGDPTTFGNFNPPEYLMQRLEMMSRQRQLPGGYVHSCGTQEARIAVARKFSASNFAVTPDDVFLTCGCSQALYMAIAVLINPGDNILIPRPAFPLYGTLAGNLGIDCKEYPLLPEQQWDADLPALEAQIDDKTKAILINNPSNPCGSLFSQENLEGILDIARRKKLPIISDEIYADMGFPSAPPFISIAELSHDVSTITVGGIGKQYMIPGYRVGWAIVHERPDGYDMSEIKKGLSDLATVTLGPTSFLQTMVPDILHGTPPQYYADIKERLEKHADIFNVFLKDDPYLKVVKPRGAMYVMIEIDLKATGFEDDVQFSRELLSEESVFVLPGTVFGAPGFFRVVTTPPIEKLQEACVRMSSFCIRRAQVAGGTK